MSLVEAGWDTEVARRPHGQRTTVVMHLDVEHRAAALHLGPLLSRRRTPVPDVRCHLRGLVRTSRPGHRLGAGDPTDQPPAAPCTRAPRPHLRGARAAGPPAVCTPTTSGTGKTAASPSCSTWCWSARITTGCTIGASSPSPDPPITSWSPTPAGRPLERGIAGPPSDHTPTRGRTLPRTHRRTRRLVVVPALPTTTTTVEQLTARIINSPQVVRLIGCLNLDPQVLMILGALL